jgi:hypothetical protein
LVPQTIKDCLGEHAVADIREVAKIPHDLLPFDALETAGAVDQNQSVLLRIVSDEIIETAEMLVGGLAVLFVCFHPVGRILIIAKIVFGFIGPPADER